MQSVELNPVGHFDPWDHTKLDELKNKDLSGAFGKCLFENDIVKLWDITLLPGERLPFRKRNSNYSLTCITGGMAISRNANGKIDLLHIKKGDMAYYEHEGKKIISDLENIGVETLRIMVLEHKCATQTLIP